ncbi:MAG TPA: ABC-F family ATP-binding cassette domain-containing protein [Chloroflexota bacterium]|nr:ABC-F family ATP-binding cassette domain-containing protein [Chloroflexota bacterium]
MPLLTAANLSLAYGGLDIFTELSFSVPEDARIGLVGPNGVGKTSLLRVLAGITPPNAGAVHLARGQRIGYLRQEAVEAFARREHTVHAEMQTVFAEVLSHAEELRALEAAMAGGDHGEEILARYGAAQEGFERGGGYDYETRIATVLDGLGFPESLWETPIAQLSGGQKTRALLARLLLEAPDLLMLDEPTNHLDMEATAWLEETLRGWPGALLIVSHDRYFLDRVADRIWELSPSTMETYRGNYSAYVSQRQERWDRRMQLFESTKERLIADIELIKRYIGWRKMVEAKGKLKRLSRELAAIAELGIEGIQGKSWSETGLGGISSLTVDEAWRQIRELRPPVGRPPHLAMHLKTTARGGNGVLRTSDLRIGYPNRTLFSAGPIDLQRQECAALIGGNGTGKTTFLRTVLGELPPLSGTVTLGANVRVGYFAQAYDALHPEHTVLEELLGHKNLHLGEAREYLARYLFRGEDVEKPVRALSGGERGRLALAILALEGANFLLLDEPTNHLDIPAQEVLQESLENFEGTLLLVSHDRYLVDRLATQIWEIENGALRVFKGPFQEYLAVRAREEIAAKAAASLARVEIRATNDRTSQTAEKETRKRVQVLASLEKRIADTEALLAQHERDLQEASEKQRVDDVRRLAEAYAATQRALDERMREWVAISE